MLTDQTAIDIASHVFCVLPGDVKGRSRKGPIVEARACASNLLRKINGWSYSQIGRALDRDHGSIVNHVNMIDEAHLYNKRLQRKWDNCYEIAKQVNIGKKDLTIDSYVIERIELLNQKMLEAVNILTQTRSEIRTIMDEIKERNNEPA